MILQKLNKPNLKVLGIMSGTSLDGIDIAEIEVSDSSGNIHYELINYRCLPIPPEIHSLIKAGFTANAEQLCSLHFELGKMFSNAIQQYISERATSAGLIDLIGFHGQTIYHIHRQCSLQLGETDSISQATNIPVVFDFRSADIAVGGSGAPLIPYFDKLICRDISSTILLQNLGGIGNLTLVPGNKDLPLQAFDTGPVNVMLNEIVEIFTQGKFQYDQDGMFSKNGIHNEALYKTMLSHPYLKQEPPKSTGREEFGHQYVKELIRQHPNVSFEDFLVTAIHFVIKTLVSSYQTLPEFEWLVLSGGGAHHPLIIDGLKKAGSWKLKKFSEFSKIHEDAKEAVAFAILAYARVKNFPSNIPEITGAKKPVSLGKLSWN